MGQHHNYGGSFEARPADLIVDEALQPRLDGLDANHVAALAACPGSWPPLTIVDRNGQRFVVDGFHRLAAATQLGLTVVQVQVIDCPADADLRSLAFDLNAKHGRPLSTADRKIEALRLLAREPQRSSRSIGRACGLSHETVERLRRQAAASGEIRQTETRVGDRPGGYEYRPRRRKGEPPEESAGEWLHGAAARMIGGREAGARRRAVSYLQRVAVALDDQFALPSSQAQALTDAVTGQLSGEDAAALGERLGAGSLNLLRVARLLGYEGEGA